MITVGVDLAAEPKTTAVARLEWGSASCLVTSLEVDVSDDAILAAAQGATKIGIDCPLGWPDEFVAFVAAHHIGHVATDGQLDTKAGRHALANRHTDDVVRERCGIVPLSVSTDRIARPAMRAAGLLALLAAAGHSVARDGSGLAAEAYPAASLKHWGFTHSKYKGAAHEPDLSTLARQVCRQAPWLKFRKQDRTLFGRSDHAFDAVIAALTARAAAIGHTHPPTPAEAEIASREGWIAVPTCGLEGLLTS